MAQIREIPPESEAGDAALVDGLRRGDEASFTALVRRHHRAVVRLAGAYTKNTAAAEDAAQETWMGVLTGIGGYEGRAPFRAWLFRIAVNVAKKRSIRDARSVPFSALDGIEVGEPAVDPGRFQEPDARWAGHWASPPEPWHDGEHRLVAVETLELVAAAIDALPAAQRQVITLRDVQGMDAEETSAILDISEGNQRVLLHRARSKVRAAIEAELGGMER